MILRTRSTFIPFVLLAALFAAGMLTGVIAIPPSYNPFAPLEIKAPRTFITPLKVWRIDRDVALCQAALRAAGISFAPRPDVRLANGCSQVGTGIVKGFTHARLSPANVQMTCGLAVRLALFDEHVLQKAARDSYGTSVAAITHFGSYACRNVNNRKTGRLSKHASADAFDIAGFTLGDGRSVSVALGWSKEQNGAFLRQVHDGACGLFSAVLGPDYNALHQNHFHVDKGFYTACR